MTRKPAEKATPGPWSTVIAHGLILFAVLLFFRVGKAIFAQISPTGFDQVALFLPEIGFVFLFEGFWLLLSRGRAGRLWNGLIIAGHLCIYGFLVVNHGFFVNTGYRVDFDLATYTVTHLSTVWSIIADSVHTSFWLQVAVILGAILLARPLAVLLQRGPFTTPHRAATIALPLLGLGLVLWSPGSSPYLRDLSRNDVAAFATSAVRALIPDDTSTTRMIAPEDLYQEPRLQSLETERRPNIVLVILESTGAGVTSPDFSGSGLSPNLAAIARDSLVLESAYSTVTHTSKTLVGMICGMVARVEMRIIESFRKNLPIPCLPTLLGELGYRTAFLQTARGTFENRPGLVENFGFAHAAFQETMLREPYRKTGYLGMDEFAMLEPAVRWARTGDEPFFLTVLTVTPHHPYELPWEESEEAPPEERYRQALQHQDAFVGALHAGLDTVGALEDTVLIIAGDHGEAFGEHKIYEHDAVPYEEVTWTPVIISGPEWLGEPRRVSGLRSHLDFMPTILEILGAQWEGLLPGRSLLSSAGHEAVFTSCWDRNRCLAMRRGDLKVVHHFRKRTTEVFDLATDPTESHDLAPTLGAGELARLEAEMRAYKLSLEAFWARFPVYDQTFD